MKRLFILLVTSAPLFAAEDFRINGPDSDLYSYTLASTSGELLSDDVSRQVAAGQARLVVHNANRQTVEHIRLEVFEGAKSASSALVTRFGFIRAEFQDSILGSGRTADMLSRLEYFIIELDAYGKTDDRYHVISYEQKVEDGALQWYRSYEQRRGVEVLYRSLPEFAKQQLWHVAGFLDMNPGRPVVAYNLDNFDAARMTINFIADLAPGLAKKAGGAVLENILKKLTVTNLNQLLQNEDLRFGADFGVNDNLAKQDASGFIAAGRAKWDLLRP